MSMPGAEAPTRAGEPSTGTLGISEPPAVPSDEPAAPQRRTRRSRARLLTVVGPLALLVLIIAGWSAISYLVLDPRRRFLLPPPEEVIQKAFMDDHNRAEILDGLLETARVSLTGFIIATVLGILVAVLMSQAFWIETTLYPYAIFIQTIPILAITPLVGFWWGFNFRSRVLVCVIISLFPIVTNTLFGLKSAEPNAHNLFTLARASRVRRLVKLELPASLPAMFTGLRIAAGGSVIGAIVGDFFFRQGSPGLGRLLDNYVANLQSAQLLGAVLVSAALGIAVFWVIGFIDRRVTGHWAPKAPQRRPRRTTRKVRA
jgi:NitT/TauT family transport system permease protein